LKKSREEERRGEERRGERERETVFLCFYFFLINI
jgi:hypothetical protein